MLILSLDATAQQRERVIQTKKESPAVTVAKGTGKVALVVVASVAKASYKATKFVGKEVAKPVLRHFVAPGLSRVVPPVGRFALRNAFRFGLPLILRLSLL